MNASSPSLAFFLDVDNTLLDNDRLKRDIDTRLCELLGAAGAERFWEIYEQVRAEEDVVDYPETVKRYAEQAGDPALGRRLDELLRGWDFRAYLYPHVMPTLAYLNTLGTTVILSDGDQVFQRIKIRESGLEAAVGGRVLIYIHKEEELKDVFRRYPADHYVVVDDKPRILAVLERDCPTEFTTVLVEQGKYAQQAAEYSPKPDYDIPHIADLRAFSREQFLSSPARRSATR